MGFTDHPDLLDFIGRLMPEWKKPSRYKKQLMRTNIPHAYKSATRVHYDQMWVLLPVHFIARFVRGTMAHDSGCRYLRGQKPGTLTAWIPVGDISPVSGGLMYLEDSLSLGIEMENKWRAYNKNLPVDEQMSGFNSNVRRMKRQRREGSKNKAHNAQMLLGGGLTRDCTTFALRTNRRWLVGQYEAGDVVFHQCRMIHCSANNEDPDERIRFATDVRFTDKLMRFEDRWDEYGDEEEVDDEEDAGDE